MSLLGSSYACGAARESTVNRTEMAQADKAKRVVEETQARLDRLTLVCMAM